MKNNKSLEKTTFFSSIKSWWYNIFHKESEENINTDEKVIVNKKSMFDKYRNENDRRRELLQLQNEYEEKIILESDISEKDKKDLEALYLKQISELKRKIKIVETKIQNIKF